MSLGSGLFSKKLGARPHLIAGSGGLSGEIADLRADIAAVLSSMSAIAVEEYTNLAAADADGIKTSIASSDAVATYTGTALNGAVGTGTMSPPRNITITTTSHANIDAVGVVVTGKDVYGHALTETITLTDGGGVTDKGVKAFASVSSIVIPAQGGTAGALTIGFGVKVGFSKKLKLRAGVNALVREIIAGAVATSPTDVAVDEWTNPAAVATAGLKTATATAAVGVVQTLTASDLIAGGKTALLTYPRNVSFTTAGSDPTHAPASVVINGTDINDAVLSESLVLGQTAGTDLGVKAFKTITSIVYGVGINTDATIAVGFGKKFGLHYPIQTRASLLAPIKEIAIAAVVTTGTIVLPATSPPNGTYAPSANPNGTTDDFAIYYEKTTSSGSVVVAASTGLPNGTYEPSLAADGLNDYTVYYEYDPTADEVP